MRLAGVGEMLMAHDPEVEALTAQIKRSVSSAFQLTRQLSATVEDLQTFVPIHARLTQQWHAGSQTRRSSP